MQQFLITIKVTVESKRTVSEDEVQGDVAGFVSELGEEVGSAEIVTVKKL
jgi:hypothetical protein